MVGNLNEKPNSKETALEASKKDAGTIKRRKVEDVLYTETTREETKYEDIYCDQRSNT